MEAAKAVPQKYERIEADAQNNALHRMNWAQAARGLTKASCPFDYAGPLTETMLLGIVALRTSQGRRIQFDGVTGRVTNATDANQFLQREYRAGWVL